MAVEGGRAATRLAEEVGYPKNMSVFPPSSETRFEGAPLTHTQGVAFADVVSKQYEY